MLRKLLSLCLLPTVILGFCSCDKEDEDNFIIETVPAILTWGEYSLDGCGYTLAICNDRYKPTNEAEIPVEYKEAGWDGMEVEVKIINYRRTEVQHCGARMPMNVVKVLEIRKK